MNKEDIYFRNLKLLFESFPDEVFSKSKLTMFSCGRVEPPKELLEALKKLIEQEHIKEISCGLITYYIYNKK